MNTATKMTRLHLLIDDEAENPRWVIEWVFEELTPVERTLLSELEG